VKLPRVEDAIVDERKLTEYLLAEGHPVGRTKARFFQGLGYSRSSADALRRALLAHARDNEISIVEETQFGSKYAVEGELPGLEGRTAQVRVIWFVEAGEKRPRFVTAYPQKDSK
jgi:hypothetical protein